MCNNRHADSSAGVAHGDIKPSNFLVEQHGNQINCLLTDFGSCVIRGQNRLPTLNPPWNAPELSHASPNLGFDHLSQADLFSLSLVCVHILLPLDILRDAGLSFLRQHQSDDEWLEFIDRLGQAKRPDTGTDSLVSRIISVISQASIPEEHKLLLESVIHSAIHPPGGSRTMPWNDIFRFEEHLSVRY
jgi:serine/threonine protein kinase